MRRSKQSNGRLRKKRISAWYKMEFQTWLTALLREGFIGDENDGVRIDFYSTMWNNRPEVKHAEGSYPDWNPYCCNPKTSCSAMQRMVRNDYGWRCTECGNRIGKHLYRINKGVRPC